VKLTPKCEAAVERWAAELSGPLTEKQKDIIAAAFRGALSGRRRVMPRESRLAPAGTRGQQSGKGCQ
jgi:hypothetical protein